MSRDSRSKRRRIKDDAQDEISNSVDSIDHYCTNLDEAKVVIDRFSKQIDQAKSCCIKLRDELKKSQELASQPESTLCTLCKDRDKNMNKLAKEKDLKNAAKENLVIELEQAKSNIKTLTIESSNYRDMVHDSTKQLEHAQQVYRTTTRNRDAMCELLLSTNNTPAHVDAVQSLSQLGTCYVKKYQSTSFKTLREELDKDQGFCRLYTFGTEEIERLMVSPIKSDHWLYPIVERHLELMLTRFTTDFKLMAPWFVQDNKPATDSLWFVRRSQNSQLKQHDTDGVQSTFDAIAQMFKRFEKTPKSGDALEVTMTRATATMCITVLTTMQRLRFAELSTMIQTKVHGTLLNTA